MSPRIVLLPENREILCPEKETLGDALVRSGIPLSLYCGRRGVCGKCFVEIADGHLPEIDERERRLREFKSLPENYRLACRYIVINDVSIRVPAPSLVPTMPILVQGVSQDISFEPVLKKIAFQPGLPENRSRDDVLAFLGSMWPGIDLKFDHPLSAAIGERLLTAVVYDDREVLDLEPGDTSGRAFGLAIDLGTTTLVVDLVDLTSGAVLGTAAGLNGQSSFGADVVSRISAAFENPRTLGDLRAAAVRSLNGLVEDLLGRRGIRPNDVYEAVVAGNTAMSHFFRGVSVDGLAVSPFEAAFSASPPLAAEATGLLLNPRGRVYLAPNIKSFVGGDITAGLVASGLDDLSGRHLFIDLGTNGEIALKKDRRLTVTSTAAGPAFEGMTLSCGMLALPGAVYKASADSSGRLSVETIGGKPPLGVCGTGLIDLVAAALSAGRLTPAGQIVDPSKRLPVTNGLSLVQQDIRETQLAAAAIKTGIRMLLEAEGLAVADLDGVYVAGAFGTYLNAENAMRIGLLPRLDSRKLTFVGNASLAGARAFLLSRTERRRGERLARGVRHLSLAKDGDFQAKFIDALEFKEWT